ncbi:MAG: lysylphosphatidylglycerol synthase transmembrane domain-containing protein [Kiloniellales bacterium]|nr:lysylphosphatidylglycerol synthase transmembrane domain-containing protein [Kiloniellales bacterium]
MSKNAALFALKLAVTAGLIYWFVLPGIDVDMVAERLDRLSPGFLVLAAALIFLQNAIVVTWRWERVVAAIDRALPPWRLLRTTVITLFFNQVLPSTIGGDGMRVWLLRGLGRPIGIAFRSVLIDRLIGFFGLLLVGLAGSLYLLLRLQAPGPVWLVALTCLAGLVLIALAPPLVGVLQRLPFDRLRQVFETLAREVRLLVRDRPRLAKLVAASIVGQLALAGAVYCLARDLEVGVELLGVFAVVPGVMVASSIPISIAGWGVREASMVVGLGLLGVAQGEAAIISIGFGLLVLGFGLLGGLVWLVRGSPQPAGDEIAELDTAMHGGADG